jgi:prepilin-type processing-associated H-X9-DG protein
VVIAMIGLLAAVLLPSLNRAKAQAKSAACRNNLRQLGIALTLYRGEFQRYPLEWVDTPDGRRAAYWSDLLLPFSDGQSRIWFCPDAGPDYQYNAAGTDFNSPPRLGLGFFGAWDIAVPDADVKAPGDMIAIGDAEAYAIAGFGWPGVVGTMEHKGRDNAVFCDGHVETSRPNTLQIITPPAGSSSDPRWWPWTGLAFKPESSQARRWNNDNEPHPETWPR